MWRDPLDELIEDLERTLPPASRPTELLSNEELVGCQILIGAIMYGHPEEIARAERDPRVKAYEAALERLTEGRRDDAPTHPDRRAQEPKPRSRYVRDRATEGSESPETVRRLGEDERSR